MLPQMSGTGLLKPGTSTASHRVSVSCIHAALPGPSARSPSGCAGQRQTLAQRNVAEQTCGSVRLTQGKRQSRRRKMLRQTKAAAAGLAVEDKVEAAVSMPSGLICTM